MAGHMEYNKNPKGRRAKRVAPLGRRRRRRFVVFHLAVETMNKKPNGNQFFYHLPSAPPPPCPISLSRSATAMTSLLSNKKSIKNQSKIDPKSIKNRYQIDQKSIPNRSKIHSFEFQEGLGAVSYTHLTLPTICSV